MAVKEKIKLVQTDENSRRMGPEIDETFLFTQNDTRGQVDMKAEYETPGTVAMQMEKSGCRTSLKKTDSPLIFRGRTK